MPRISKSTGNVEAHTRLKAEGGQSAIPASYIVYVVEPDEPSSLVIVQERRHPLAMPTEIHRERQLNAMRYLGETIRAEVRLKNRAKSS
jgi:hypothetical protein